jgi:hypothetical protein
MDGGTVVLPEPGITTIAQDNCGNGNLDAGEECDPSVPASTPEGYRCSNVCELEEIIGTPPPPEPTPEPPTTGGGETGGGRTVGDEGTTERFAQPEGVIQIQFTQPRAGIQFTDAGSGSVGFSRGFTIGYSEEGRTHYSRPEAEEILSSLIRRHALPEEASIDILPIVAQHEAADQTSFEKVRNYIFNNLLEFSLILIFVIALAIDINKILAPKKTALTGKITEAITRSKEDEK